MSNNIDRFESLFRAAAHDPFEMSPVEIHSVLIVTDLARTDADGFADRIRYFLKGLKTADQIDWRIVTGDEFEEASLLLELVEQSRPDLICTYRNLHSSSWKHPFSLGEYLDVLTQVASAPVLIAPHPLADYISEHALENSSKVMAITSHLNGDHRLVNYAAAFTQADGELYLTHIEDRIVFDRYIETIGKIPTLDTDEARKTIAKKLLEDTTDYIESCKKVFAEARVPIAIKEIVDFGQRVADYKRYIEKFEIDLLVMHAKDDDQMAMHGHAYPLAIELRQIPLLML